MIQPQNQEGNPAGRLPELDPWKNQLALKEWAKQWLEATGIELGARRMGLNLFQPTNPEPEIHVVLTCQGNRWSIAKGIPTDKGQIPSQRPGVPEANSRREFGFPLELPLGWQGFLKTYFSRALGPKSRKLSLMERSVECLNDKLTSILLGQALKQSQSEVQFLQAEQRGLQDQFNQLSKDLYCIGQLPNLVDKALDEAHFLENVLKVILPLINACVGAIHVPEIELEMVLGTRRTGPSSSRPPPCIRPCPR